MFVAITNTPRDFAWGAPGAISRLLGEVATGAAEAEVWLGAHPGSPSRILDPELAGGATDLASWIAADPGTALGEAGATHPRLPFLLKVLAAASPLSLQAHPTAQQAILGFAREHTEGVPLTAPNRNYKDVHPKPEMIYALEDGFEALCGFKPLVETHAIVGRLIELDLADPESELGPLHRWFDKTAPGATIEPVFEWLITKGEGVAELVGRVGSIAIANPGEFPDLLALAEAHPGDPGIVVALMLNRVELARGEVLYLPAGNIHTYLKGIGVELMNASDNVLRGGLTTKHVDVAELLGVLDFTPTRVPYLTGETIGASITRFAPPDVDFELLVVAGDGRVALPGAAIVLCEAGHFEMFGCRSFQRLSRGQIFYATPDERELRFEGSGTVFVATSG